MSRDITDRLRDVKENLERVIRLTKNLDQSAFESDEAIYYAVIYSLGIAGEAVKSIPDDVRAKAPDVDWKAIARLRDLLFHVYFGISNDVIWQIVTVSVPQTLVEVDRLTVLEEEGPGDRPQQPQRSNPC